MYINVLAVRLCCSFHRDCRVCIILHKYFRNKTDSNEIGSYDKVHCMPGMTMRHIGLRCRVADRTNRPTWAMSNSAVCIGTRPIVTCGQRILFFVLAATPLTVSRRLDPMAAASGIISQAPPTGRRDWSVGGTRHTSFMTSRSAAEPRLRAADQ